MKSLTIKLFAFTCSTVLFFACGDAETDRIIEPGEQIQSAEPVVEVDTTPGFDNVPDHAYDEDGVDPGEAMDGEWEYGIIVAYNAGDPNETSEDWSWFIHEIAEAFKDEYIIVTDTYQDNMTVEVELQSGDYAVLDITEPLNGATSGYIFYKDGANPHFVDYNMSSYTIEAAQEYFGLGD